jgi:two-component system phosphate regulon sensor histidine kinase PhoR
MAVDRASLASQAAVPSLVVVLAAGAVAAFFEPARSVAFVFFFVAALVCLWCCGALVRSYLLQSARLARMERRVGNARALAETRDQTFRDLIEGLRVMMLVVDDKFTIVAANKTARKAFDFRNPVGESLIGVTHSHELEQLAGLASKSKSRLRDELTLSFPNEARVRVYAWRNTAVPGQVFISILDVTELRRLQTVRRDFVANVSHELRTPMTTIRAMAETMLEGGPEDQELTQRYLEKIVREVDRLTAMTDDLLTLSKVENERPLQKPFDLAEVVRGVVSQLEQKAEQQGIALRCTTVDEARVMGSGSEMTQVVLNLVDNALNYTSEGSVEVSLGVDGGQAVLKVADTGIGISEEHQARIFERFYRVDKGRSRATGGTGLGLSIVKHIVQTHEGSIEVDSELNKGTTFTVRLPLEG